MNPINRVEGKTREQRRPKKTEEKRQSYTSWGWGKKQELRAEISNNRCYTCHEHMVAEPKEHEVPKVGFGHQTSTLLRAPPLKWRKKNLLQERQKKGRKDWILGLERGWGHPDFMCNTLVCFFWLQIQGKVLKMQCKEGRQLSRDAQKNLAALASNPAKNCFGKKRRLGTWKSVNVTHPTLKKMATKINLVRKYSKPYISWTADQGSKRTPDSDSPCDFTSIWLFNSKKLGSCLPDQFVVASRGPPRTVAACIALTPVSPVLR